VSPLLRAQIAEHPVGLGQAWVDLYRGTRHVEGKVQCPLAIAGPLVALVRRRPGRRPRRARSPCGKGLSRFRCLLGAHQESGLGRFDQRVECRTGMGSTGTASEQPSFSPDHKGPDSVRNDAVVDGDAPIFEEGGQLRPKPEGVRDGLTEQSVRPWGYSRRAEPIDRRVEGFLPAELPSPCANVLACTLL
jgi:hypothetical protein